MASLLVGHVSYHYTGFALEDVSLSLPSGSTSALVGASGSGKTTILNLIAGFIMPSSGRILIGGQCVAENGQGLAANKRGVGLVFQQHALFPHLKVADNILFGCPQSGEARQHILESLLADFHISALAERYPHELSGGEQQRVALARALAAGPRILLMDEPFSSIDTALRRDLRLECMEVLRAAGVTSLMVTHDAEEALELAEKIWVLDQGKLVQSGSAQQLYFEPASERVASLFGEVNCITDPLVIRALGGGEAKQLLIRPESIRVSKEAGALQAAVIRAYFHGNHYLAHIRPQGSEQVLKLELPSTTKLEAGELIYISRV